MNNVSVVITSCGRFDLLDKTISSFFKYNSYKNIKEIIIIEDSGKPEACIKLNSILNKYQNINIVLKIIINPHNIGQVESIDKAYSQVTCPYIFHLEDDWEFYKSGFIEKSIEILKHNDWVYTVWLRNYNDTQNHPIEITHNLDFNLMTLNFLDKYHGFTWNPGLRRLSDYNKIGSFQESAPSEVLASELYKKLGYRAAITKNTNGYVRHIGTNELSTAYITNTKKG
jgi:hypothetical protein